MPYKMGKNDQGETCIYKEDGGALVKGSCHADEAMTKKMYAALNMAMATEQKEYELAGKAWDETKFIPVLIVNELIDTPPTVDTGSAELTTQPDTGSKESLKETIIDWVVRTFGKKDKKELLNGGFKALPNGKWVAYHTNNFEDRAGETFSQKSHEQYIDWLEKELIPYPELWYRHIAGTKHGQAEWVGQIGHLIVSVGSFDDTPVAELFQKEYAKHPYQTSHTYAYPPSARDADGTYHAYFTIEISPVPAGLAANPYTTFTEVKEVAKSKEENRKALLPILGKEWTDKVLGEGEIVDAALEKAGLKSKEIEGLPIVDAEARAALEAFITMSKEAGDAAQKSLNEQIAAIAAGIKAFQDGEAARNEAVTKLETFVKEQFELAPRASQSKQTVVDPKDPQVVALAAKAADPNATKPDPNATPGENLANLFLNFKAQS